jgi:hypothetical protein
MAEKKDHSFQTGCRREGMSDKGGKKEIPDKAHVAICHFMSRRLKRAVFSHI